MDKTLQVHLKELREQIAAEIEKKLMPLCVCNRCGNLIEAQIVTQAATIARGNHGTGRPL